MSDKKQPFKFCISFNFSLQKVKTRLTQEEFNQAKEYLEKLGVHFSASINDFGPTEEYDDHTTRIYNNYKNIENKVETKYIALYV